MRVLFIGDIVGQVGVAILRGGLPLLRRHYAIDLVIANAENVAGGSGLTPKGYRQLRRMGVDAITMGDHVYKRMEIAPTLESEPDICRPANFPSRAPGRDLIVTECSGIPVAVFCLLGRTFMRPVDCPFSAADRLLARLEEPAAVFVDFHAEATGEKYAMAHHLRGRVTALLGTHTHVQTADEQLFPEGTAYITDVGMTGPYDGVIGRRADRILSAALTFVPTPFDVAEGDPRIAGAIVDVDPESRRATAIERLLLDEEAISRLEPSSSS